MSIFDPVMLCHGNNLAQKTRVAPDDRIRTLCAEIQRQHDKWVASLSLDETLKGDFDASVKALNEYVDYAKEIEKREKYFNWRSDFAGSVIPEYLYRVLAYRLHHEKINAIFSSRHSVVEVTLASTSAAGWYIRHKNQDLCIGLRTASITVGNIDQTFVVPQVVFEVKTNLDINKLNGLDFSAERLKRSFPQANYMVLTETIDFSLDDNFASGSIDEIYVGRRQLRSISRRAKTGLCAVVFRDLVNDVSNVMRRASSERGHVYERLVHGKLINV